MNPPTSPMLAHDVAPLKVISAVVLQSYRCVQEAPVLPIKPPMLAIVTPAKPPVSMLISPVAVQEVKVTYIACPQKLPAYVKVSLSDGAVYLMAILEVQLEKWH